MPKKTHRGTPGLIKLESLAVLEAGYGRDSASGADEVKFGNFLPGLDDDDKGSRDPPVTVDLSIRRGRLALLAVLAVAIITVTTAFFNRGLEVGYFNGKELNETQRDQLLDDYNSYSANVASAFGKPIEVFIALAVQIIVLRFMIKSMTTPKLSWKAAMVTIALSTGIGYLINNGFNAVNVQLRSSEIQAVISASDLSTQANESTAFSDTVESMRTTTELSPKNPITNTILRNVVRTRTPKAPARCNWFYSQPSFGDLVPDTVLDFGFAQREWQSRLLQEALEPKVLRVVANATDKSVNKNVKAADLPMNASLAADLYMYAMVIGQHRMKWVLSRPDISYDDNDVRAKRYPGKEGPESFAKMAGFLPPTKQSVSETEQAEWFIREVQARLPRALSSNAAVTSDLAVEFSHVDVSRTVKFDAITIEIEVNPTMLSNATDAGRKKVLYQADECGPWPGLCMIKKTRLTTNPYEIKHDTSVQVFAVGSCLNEQGEETLTVPWKSDSRLGWLDCEKGSTTSMIVGSIGKRLVADSIQQNTTFDRRGTIKQPGTAVVTNLRKIYSFTVGRLSWEVEDLAQKFGAACDGGPSSCMGVQVPILPPLHTATGSAPIPQRLVAGVDALPVGRLPLINDALSWNFPSQPIVELMELARAPQVESVPEYTVAAGDPLFLHNVKVVEWDNRVLPVMNKSEFIDEVTPATCIVQVEDRLFMAIKNHMYMEHSLQPAYTAATFFLLQDAVVRDTISVNETSTTLNFDKNVEKIALFVSIPDRNAWLTFGGCIVLVVSLGFVLLSSIGKQSASFGTIQEPHAVARVMLDEAQYPSAVLHRRVVCPTNAKKEFRELGEFTINGISLQAQEEY